MAEAHSHSAKWHTFKLATIIDIGERLSTRMFSISKASLEDPASPYSYHSRQLIDILRNTVLRVCTVPVMYNDVIVIVEQNPRLSSLVRRALVGNGLYNFSCHTRTLSREDKSKVMLWYLFLQ